MRNMIIDNIVYKLPNCWDFSSFFEKPTPYCVNLIDCLDIATKSEILRIDVEAFKTDQFIVRPMTSRWTMTC
jgi:hypothetical protein